ncbi:MAG: hypothetical protein EXS00_02125 [Phycisphaerales bacterium]|nr:hypothetical protein [Phycisphaerales bacterium]
MALDQSGSARRAGPADVYTVVLIISAILLVGGGALIAVRNIEVSSLDGQQGGAFTLVDK